VTLNDYFDRIIVINLERRTDRLEQFDAEAKRIGFEYEVHKAVDGKAEGIDPIVAGRLSHIQVLESIKPDEMVLICEDDAVFCDDFLEKFETHMAKLPQDWDIFYLGAVKNRTEPVNDYWVRQLETTGTHAYCIKPEKVEYFIQVAKDFDLWIDVAYRLVSDKTNAYVCHPNISIQSEGFSDLRGHATSDFKGFR
jgi:GR25 family glycosyltransferase involved in LPS biosynthesis